MPEPLLLSRRLAPDATSDATTLLVLSLSAAERQRLRGHCRSACGRDLLLQLPRGAALEPGERLAGDDGRPRVQVEAAPEPLLQVRCSDPLTLLRATYHLGNRHVALELRSGELRLLHDPVLAELLRGLGLTVGSITAPFEPEGGAYDSSGHGHGHNHSHSESHADDPSNHHNDTDSHGHELGNGHSHSTGHHVSQSHGQTPSHRDSHRHDDSHRHGNSHRQLSRPAEHPLQNDGEAPQQDPGSADGPGTAPEHGPSQAHSHPH